MEFERALQAADVDNGGDGRIALPYWDCAPHLRKACPS
jgi:hypothetical protein